MILLGNTLFHFCLLLYFAPFYVGSKINDRRRALLTQALRFGDEASSSYCSNSGGPLMSDMFSLLGFLLRFQTFDTLW